MPHIIKKTKVLHFKFHFPLILSIILGLLFSLSTTAQTPGLIFDGLDPNNVLDPNNDGYVSLPPSETPSQFVNIGFPANINDTDVFDIRYSEIPYTAIPQLDPEPTADITKGPDCGFTDMVEDANSQSSYYYTDNTNMLFRFRLGGAAPNSKGYSVLIDTDDRFGFSGLNADTNATAGNPGFEIEIVLRTNFEINAYNIDGNTTGGGTPIATRPYLTHAIKSLALTTVCDDPDYFYDFYLPFSDLVGFISNTTKLRMVTITSISPKKATGENTTSDLSGADDGSATVDTLFEDLIVLQTPTNGAPLERAICPIITGGNTLGAIINGDTQITGTSTEENGTLIQVYINDVAHSTTTAVTGGAWTQTGLTLSTDDVIKATATVPITVTSGIEKGTSVDNCSTKIVLLTNCTPPATPVITEVGNSGKDLNGTITGINGQTVLIRLFSNGTEVTAWGGANTDGATGYFTATISGTGTWIISGGGGYKAFSGYYSVIIIPTATNCPSIASSLFPYCNTGGGGDGVLSGSITFASPSTVLISTEDISGVLGNTSATTVRLYKNSIYTGISATFTGTTAWSLDISSLTLVADDVLHVTNKQDTSTCTSVSANKTVSIKSLQPSINGDYCADGNLTSISGTSSEIGGTIRLYSKASPGVTTANTAEGTAIVGPTGSWTITGRSIAPGSYIAATVQNVGEAVSLISGEVLITAKTTGVTLTITSDPIKEGDASITGTSTGLPTGSIVQLYLDDAIIDLATGETDGSGNWSILGLDTPFDELYTDAVVTVKGIETGKCESDPSASKVVKCVPPVIPSITAFSTSPICENNTFIITIASAKPGVAYQLLDQNNNAVGPTIIGPNPAASVNIETNPIAFGITSLKVKAFKFLATCTTVESNAVSITVNPAPTIDFSENPSATFNASAQTVNLTFSGTTNSPNQYKIDFDDVSFTDISFTSLPASPIVIDVPAGLSAGVYTATVTIQEPVNGCQKSYPITITILDPAAPTITLTNSNDNLCAGATSASFVYSATSNSPTLYSVDFNDTANLQGFTDVVNATLTGSPIIITTTINPNAGVYKGVITLKTAGGLISKEYPITITIRRPDPGSIIGNQVINSGLDVAAFTSLVAGSEDLGTITYQWQRSTISATAGFTNISGATSATYDEGTRTITTYYKRIVNSDIGGTICSAESEVLKVTVINLGGIPMITQVYQFGSEKWIEITNVSSTNSIAGGNIKIQLYSDVSRTDQTDAIPTNTYLVTAALTAGQSVLIKNINNVISVPGTPETNNSLTSFNGANDIITLSTTTDETSWGNRYDAVSKVSDNTSYVRIDEALFPNPEYTSDEWVVFIDDALPSVFNGFDRHPHAPLISEISSANAAANTKLGVHKFGSTTTSSGNTWANGFPDRSRYAIVNQNYKHQTTRLTARKLEVQGTNILSLDSQLLVVTNNVNIADGAEIRLLGTSQFIQSHTGIANITGNGKIYIDQKPDLSSIYRYNYMSSPVSTLSSSTYTLASVFKDGTIPLSETGIVGQGATNIARDINFISGLDGSTGTPIDISRNWIYTFASNAGQRSSWVGKTETNTIPVTDGFIFKGTEVAQNYTFVGNPNDGLLTTVIGANDSYLVGNPYPSSLNALKFIDDNLSSIDGTLYFWDHVGVEDDTSNATAGHSYSGYVGGYATINLSLGVSALSQVNTTAYSVTLEAEEGTTSGIQTNDGEATDVVTLDQSEEFITFSPLTRPTDIVTIRYKSSTVTNLDLKKDGVIIGTYTLPSSGGIYTNFIINECFQFSTILRLDATNAVPISIDNIIISDEDGTVSCAPGSGAGGSYKTPGTHIPVGQGFFIGGSENGGNIIFNNNQREFVTKGATSVFFKSQKSKTSAAISMLKLGMNYVNTTDNQKYHRQIGISFNAKNSFSYDKGFDSEINDIGKTDIYWKFKNNDTPYVIAGVQEITDNLEVPLEIIMDYSGLIDITLDEIKSINRDVYITDKVLNTSYKITNDEVTLTLEKGVYKNRFVLAFAPTNVLSLNDPLSNDFINIYTDTKNNQLVITKYEELNINKVVLYSILGKKMALWNLEEQMNYYQLNIKKEIPMGIYIVKLNTNKGIINKKIIIE